MRLMIADKPAHANLFIKAGVVPHDTHIVVSFGIGHWRYKLPKLNFSDIPFTENPSDLEPRFNWLIPSLAFTPNNKLLVGTGQPADPYKESSKADKEKQLNQLVDFLKSNLHKYEEIILCVDNDQRGMWSAQQLLDTLPKALLPPVSSVRYEALDHQSIQKGWECRNLHTWDSNSFGEKLASQQQVKKHFDYWWYCNSMLVLNEACKKAGLSTETLMSKFEFMLINILNQQTKPLSLHDALKLMEQWRGTGKYDSSKIVGCIGSPTSRNSIIDNAIERGALHRITKQEELISLTDKGRVFLSGLHPKSFDPDLPFRLASWCIDQNYDAPRRYIRTLFGRQLRYQRKQFRCSGASQILLKALEQGNVIALILPETDRTVTDTFQLTTTAHVSIGTLYVTAMQSGYYKLTIEATGGSMSDVVDTESSIQDFAVTALNLLNQSPINKK